RLEGCLWANPASAASSARLPAINRIRIKGAFLDDHFAAVLIDPPEKATAVTLVADARPRRVDADQDRIGVAIDAHFAHAQRVAALFALAPELASCAAVERDLAAGSRRLISFLVHETEHKHFARPRILNDRGNKPIELSEIQIHLPSQLKSRPHTAGALAKHQDPKKKPAGRLSRQRVNESVYVSATQPSAGTALRRDDDGGDDDARAD